HYDLANTLMMGGRPAEAVASLDRALALRPDRREWRFNRGHALLALGRLDEAWADLDAYWRGQRRRSWREPEWDGARLAGPLLVWSDQGIGDEVLGCGMLGDAAARAGGLVVESDPRLVPLLRRSFPEATVVPRAQPPTAAGVPEGIAAQVAMTALPRLLRRRVGDFLPHRGYLRADPHRTATLRARYRAQRSTILVGVSWRSANRTVGERKSFGLPGWAPVLQVPGVTFVSLQYGEVAADVAAAEAATGARIVVDPAIDALADLDGFAAQVAAMDLVITVSNSTAHFAGALGRPCWLMLPGGNGLLWHWILCHGDGCPWYPSIRAFRQEREGGWPGMIARVGNELRRRGAA
ncbi:MAG: hypothetical protein IT561_10330, partial [Alphaproteobacteria bacterium]|nr:hypothetical protein [Alphaproteobacteria bacterium]